jgi:diazepam-binding inhibitor (GABA receptor modulating acyl-CoA-binding protein)
MTNDELLQVYGLFKQANLGDNNTDKPGIFSLEAKAKWGAWNDQKGKSKEQAANEYVALAKQLLIKYKCEDLAQF